MDEAEVEIQKDLLFLEALLDAGVDNWEGYDDAYAQYLTLLARYGFE